MRILAHKQRRDETRTNSKQRGARRHARRISKTSIIVASLRLSPFDHFRRVNSHRRGILVVFSLLVLYLYMLYMVGCIWFPRRHGHQPIHFQPGYNRFTLYQRDHRYNSCQRVNRKILISSITHFHLQLISLTIHTSVQTRKQTSDGKS